MKRIGDKAFTTGITLALDRKEVHAVLIAPPVH